MALTEDEIARAEVAMNSRLSETPRAVRVRYDRRRSRVVLSLNNGLEVAFPPKLAEGLDVATADELSDVEITPTGLGLHWPKLDADLYVPALLSGLFGSRQWMAGELGRRGGGVSSPAKVAAARSNGRRGGRPKKMAATSP